MDGDTCGQFVRYATLSHCWGTPVRIVLTTSVLHSFQTGIDYHALPANFQHTIYATRSLELRYIWIDALCIIQNSKQDWSEQAPQMGHIYRHAYVNLSALSAHGNDSGFLNTRQLPVSTSLNNGLYIRQGRPPWTRIFSEAPLTTRAWVLQERLFSPRIVHFHDSETFWECFSVSAREGSDDVHSEPWQGLNWMDESFKRSFALEAILCNTNNESQEKMIELLMAQWYRIMCQYSTLNMTYHEDRFPAIAGIAQKFQEATSFTYIAGLWEEQLLSGLLWYAETANSRSHPTKIAPTWSWAAHCGPVKMVFPMVSEPRPSSFDAEVLQTILEPVMPGSSFLHVMRAEIVLEAHCLDVWCRSSSNGHAPYSDPYLKMTLDVFNDEGAFIGTGHYDKLPLQTIFQSVALIVSSRETSPNMEMVHVDHTRHGRGTSSNSLHGERVTKISRTKRLTTYFLLIHGTSSNAKGSYERVGIGQTTDDTHGYPGQCIESQGLSKRRITLV